MSPAEDVLRLVPLGALTSSELEAWHRLRATNPALDSPFFHPGFAEAVHASGNPVDVLVSTDATGDVRALWPIHLRNRTARPVGWPGADFQGPVLAPGTTLGLPRRLRGLPVRTVSFDHLVDHTDEFASWVQARHPSPLMDVEGGLDGYLGRASKSGRDNMGQARRRAAKAGRELGPVRFVADSTDPELLDRVIALKRAQYAATGARDYFADPARQDLVHRLLRTRGTDFGGVLSAVYAGPHLLAAHFGLRSGSVLHWWFPVYDPDQSRLAPGWVLLRELVAAAPSLDVSRIDLGRGEDEYKRRAMTAQTTVGEGVVSTSTMVRAADRAQRRAIAAAKTSPLGPRLRSAVRRMRRDRPVSPPESFSR